MEYISLTKDEVLALADKLEGFCGMKCENIRQLNENSTKEEYYKAWRQDRSWFRGYADTIYEMT